MPYLELRFLNNITAVGRKFPKRRWIWSEWYIKIPHFDRNLIYRNVSGDAGDEVAIGVIFIITHVVSRIEAVAAALLSRSSMNRNHSLGMWVTFFKMYRLAVAYLLKGSISDPGPTRTLECPMRS